ncbi:hypothetical protein [Roseateles sp.]
MSYALSGRPLVTLLALCRHDGSGKFGAKAGPSLVVVAQIL